MLRLRDKQELFQHLLESKECVEESNRVDLGKSNGMTGLGNENENERELAQLPY